MHRAVASRNAAEQQRGAEAIRHIGTNALPMLFHILRAHDSRLQIAFRTWAGNQKLVRWPWLSANQRRFQAAMGYEVLGPAAYSQVPALIETLEHDRSPQVRHYAAEVLGMIGPKAKAAVPALLRGTRDKDDLVRLSSLGALSRIHPAPELAIPVFIEALNDPGQSRARELAAMALGSYGPQARDAVPPLLSTLRTNNAAAEALAKIDPEAAADAGAK